MNVKSTWTSYSNNMPVFPCKENPTILSFSCYFHDSAACIIKNRRLVAAAEEERFSRKKHDADFPRNAIQFCLKEAQVDKVDIVVFYEDPDVKWQRIQSMIEHCPPSEAFKKKINIIWSTIKSKSKIQEKFYEETKLDNEILFLDHHLCHAASAYYMSGFDSAAVVTLDGVGESITTAFGRGIGDELSLEHAIHFPHSIGLFYTALTVFLGFKANDHEYKVMGLAPYGEMDRRKNPYYDKLNQVIEIFNDGSFKLNMDYFGHGVINAPACLPLLSELLSLEPNIRDGAITKNYKNLAAALQLVTEDTVLGLLEAVHKKIPNPFVCLSGGVALNSVINGKIISKTPFDSVFIQPAAGDSGTVIGAAKLAQYYSDNQSPMESMTISSYGPSYSRSEILRFLEGNNIVYKEFPSTDELIDEIATLIKSQAIIGWFQGRMEWGPRALGNRSILATPLYDDMRDILNEKVKHRELFRPFAPVICADDVTDYFDCDEPLPRIVDFMLMVYNIKKDKRHLIPAVCHVDGSGRLQTIHQEQNPLYYDLIKRFGELTGVPVLINTSFNIRGEPIVCSPQDAFKCMMGTDIDYLVIDHYLVKRADNLKNEWTPIIKD